jgi:hypothetical protein
MPASALIFDKDSKKYDMMIMSAGSDDWKKVMVS